MKVNRRSTIFISNKIERYFSFPPVQSTKWKGGIYRGGGGEASSQETGGVNGEDGRITPQGAWER